MMRIVNLIENTEGAPGCVAAHGLAFYVETERHRLLMDTGPSEETLRNAKNLGIELETVDTVILSHGHYDHAGGLLSFAEINPQAEIYMQQSADGEYYADDGADKGDERYRYIGIDRGIMELPRLRLINGDHMIDEELELFTLKKRRHPLPSSNRRIMMKHDDGYAEDEFIHEQYLVIHSHGMRILMSGCAHNGILNIMDEAVDRFGEAPDIVISGFHLMKKSAYDEDEIREIIDIAKQLKQYPSRFITCHCTGVLAYELMRENMESLSYIHSGEEIFVTEGSKTVDGEGEDLRGEENDL